MKLKRMICTILMMEMMVGLILATAAQAKRDVVTCNSKHWKLDVVREREVVVRV